MNHSDGETLASFVKELPDLYQPIYGHPELSEAASRVCEDRLRELAAVYRALSEREGRALRVLDLGCAQGYFAFGLAAEGASVVGIDSEPKNITVCNALAKEYPLLELSFRASTIESLVTDLQPGEFDIVLGLSIFHHLCAPYGRRKVRTWVASLLDKVQVGLIELALAKEPMSWAPFLPVDEWFLLSDCGFIHELGRFGTHIAGGTPRPLFFCSNRYWYLNGSLGAFERWTSQPYQHELDAHGGMRRYFFQDDTIVKLVRLVGRAAEVNRDEIELEARFLTEHADVLSVPRLVLHGSSDYEAWLAREMVAGELLIDLIKAKRPYDHVAVIAEVLDYLAMLEGLGLYHDDVRTWNVIIGKEGHATLIDYGAISYNAQDRVWPWHLVLAFIIFMHEVSTGVVGLRSAARPPFISAWNLPEPCKGWVLALWEQPVEAWTFANLAAIARSPAAGRRQPSAAESAWMGAIELRIAELADLLYAEAGEKAREMERVTTALEELRDDLSHKERTNQALQSALQDREATLQHQQVASDELLIQLKQKGAEVSSLTASAGELTHQLRDKDNAIDGLHRAAETLRLQLHDKEHSITGLHEAAQGLRSQHEAEELVLNELHEAARGLRSQLEEKERVLNGLHEAAEKLRTQVQEKEEEIGRLSREAVKRASLLEDAQRELHPPNPDAAAQREGP